MASPSISWKKYLSVGDSGSAIGEITLGTVTAGAWSTCICIGVDVATTTAKNVRFWMNDSTAVVQGLAVSMGAAAKPWGIRATAVSALASGSAIFGTKGGAWAASTSLAADFKAAPLNSLGAGIAMGKGASLTITIPPGSAKSRYCFLSINPHISAFDGEHTGFTFQLGYDFS